MTNLNALAAGVSYLDLQFQGLPRVIATAVLHGRGGVALIDPGPSTTLPALRSALGHLGIAMADVTELLLTHIHLDHAGATGALVNENPRLRVFVHENGAPHLINPEKLLASAKRLYGDQMDSLWGDVRPVAADAVVTLRGDERIEAGGRQLQVAYIPGHASHHVGYFSGDTGIAFIGDTLGVRLPATGYVVAPTPPPDIDLEAWRGSVDRIEAWRPDAVFLTHFGLWSPIAPHVAEFGEHLELESRLVKSSLEGGGADEDRQRWFVEQMVRELRRRTNLSDAATYEAASRFDLSWKGLARYWRKRG